MIEDEEGTAFPSRHAQDEVKLGYAYGNVRAKRPDDNKRTKLETTDKARPPTVAGLRFASPAPSR